MADLILRREQLKYEYEVISMANQSIRNIAKSAGVTAGLCEVTALEAIQVISELSLRATPGLDEVFYPDEELASES